MTVVTVGSHRAQLRLTGDNGPGAPASLVAELVMDGLRATRTVVDAGPGFVALAEYFTAMEADWRGWGGTRRWESLEGDLIIEARHDGQVDLVVILRDDPAWHWTATARLRLEPGEQLSATAAGLRELVAGSWTRPEHHA